MIWGKRGKGHKKNMEDKYTIKIRSVWIEGDVK